MVKTRRGVSSPPPTSLNARPPTSPPLKSSPSHRHHSSKSHVIPITQESSATCHSCSLHSTPRKVPLMKRAPVLAMGEGHVCSCMPFMHTLLPRHLLHTQHACTLDHILSDLLVVWSGTFSTHCTDANRRDYIAIILSNIYILPIEF